MPAASDSHFPVGWYKSHLDYRAPMLIQRSHYLNSGRGGTLPRQPASSRCSARGYAIRDGHRICTDNLRLEI
jgi:hypothetical protein